MDPARADVDRQHRPRGPAEEIAFPGVEEPRSLQRLDQPIESIRADACEQVAQAHHPGRCLLQPRQPLGSGIEIDDEITLQVEQEEGVVRLSIKAACDL